MATSRQGNGVVKELSKTNQYRIRAITRNVNGTRAKELEKLPNVSLVKGDLLDKESLCKAFEGVEIIFGNTTPTKGWKIFRGSIVREYELEQGKNLVDEVNRAFKKGKLNHFIFSSICKAKNPLKNDPVPGHFSSKWNIEDYIELNNLQSITTILRPVSYFENFENKLPGYSISQTIFPGIIGGNYKWQTIAVEDIGKWVKGVLSKQDKYKNKSLNIATEELTGEEMAHTLENLISSEVKKTKYLMIPRTIIKLLETDIGVMADWIERSGYGANMDELKEIERELNIKPTSLQSWLRKKLIDQNEAEVNGNSIWNYHWKNNKWNLQLDKQ